jgi:hypothetical protein
MIPRETSTMRLLFCFMALCVMASAALAGVAPDPTAGDGGVSDFYLWKGDIPAQAGRMLRHEPLAGDLVLSNAQTAERILYSSTDGIGGRAPITVSGVLYLPKGNRPAGGWPILSWGHGTTGVADVCAPSWMGHRPARRETLNAWLAQGFAVVASDYQGLGTPGPHPYLMYKPEGYGVLDAARAALHLYPELLANKIFTAGQSQGSGAVLGAAWLAPQYAPELNLLGTVASGLVVDVADPGDAPQVPPHVFSADEDPDEAAYLMLFLVGTARAIDPAIDPAAHVTDAGKQLLQAGQRSCFPQIRDLAYQQKLSFREGHGRNAYRQSYDAIIASVDKARPFPDARFTTPVMTVTGLADAAAPPAGQYNFIASMCHEGAAVLWHYYPGETHNSAVNKSLPDAMSFAKRLLAGTKAGSNCTALHPPGPLQRPSATADDR